MRRNAQAGTGLLYGVLATILVLGALAQVASGLARQVRVVRSFHDREVTADLAQAARVLAVDRIRDRADWNLFFQSERYIDRQRGTQCRRKFLKVLRLHLERVNGVHKFAIDIPQFRDL